MLVEKRRVDIGVNFPQVECSDYLSRYIANVFQHNLSEYRSFLSCGEQPSFEAYVNSALSSEETRALLMARNSAETVLYAFAYDLGDFSANRLLLRWPINDGDWRCLSSAPSEAIASAYALAMERFADFDFLDSDFDSLGNECRIDDAIHTRRPLRDRRESDIELRLSESVAAEDSAPETLALRMFGLELVRRVFNPTVAQAALFKPDNPLGARERAAYARQADMEGKLRFLVRYFSELALTNIHRMFDAAAHLKLMVPLRTSCEGDAPDRWAQLSDMVAGDVAAALRGDNGAIRRALGTPSVFDEYALEPPAANSSGLSKK